jgi:hypothetical protein
MFRITGLLDVGQGSEFLIVEDTTFRKLDLIPSSDERRETPTLLSPLERAPVQCLRLALSKGPNRVGTFLPSPEGGGRCTFRKIVLSSI